MKLRDAILKEARIGGGARAAGAGGKGGFWEGLKEWFLPGVRTISPQEEAVLNYWKCKRGKDIEQALNLSPQPSATEGYRDWAVTQALGKNTPSSTVAKDTEAAKERLIKWQKDYADAMRRKEEILNADPRVIAARDNLNQLQKAKEIAEANRNTAKAKLDAFLATKVGKNTILNPKTKARLSKAYSDALLGVKNADDAVLQAQKDIASAERFVPGLQEYYAEYPAFVNQGRAILTNAKRQNTLNELNERIKGTPIYGETSTIELTPELEAIGVTQEQLDGMNAALKLHNDTRDAYHAEQQVLPQILKRKQAVKRNWIIGAGAGGLGAGALYGSYLQDEKKQKEEEEALKDFVPSGSRD